jgi:hypothetical protein
MWPPSSPTRTNSAARPSVNTSCLRNQAPKPNAMPVFRLQARQWHTEIRKGSPEHVAESWPHGHSARRVVIVGSYTCHWRARKKANSYHILWFRDARTTIGRFVPSKLVSAEARVSRFRAGRVSSGNPGDSSFLISSTRNPPQAGSKVHPPKGTGDSESVPASLARSCPRSFPPLALLASSGRQSESASVRGAGCGLIFTMTGEVGGDAINQLDS